MDHPLINKIKEDMNGANFKEWIQILYDHAVLIEGKNLTNSAQHVMNINSLLLNLLGSSSSISKLSTSADIFEGKEKENHQNP